MKVRYKITLAFVLLTVILLAALCSLTYYITADQKKTEFDRRLLNRTETIASLLSKLPSNGYQVLSKLDSSTTNLFAAVTLHVYDSTNRNIYQFSKHSVDSFDIDPKIIEEARRKNVVQTSMGKRDIVAVYYKKNQVPIVVVISAIDEYGRKDLNDLGISLLIAFFAGIILSLLAGWLFSRRLLGPVEKIATTVNTISATNIEARLPESGINDEWNKLAVTFNNLLQRLQDSFELQGRFISNASHEMSTPLTAVSNQIDVTLQKNRSNEEYLNVLHSVRADVEHMSALTQQLLNIARTARGGMLSTESIRVDEVIMELPALLRKISPDHTALLFFDNLPENEKLCTVNGNYELLLSAFRNIAENGCKYAPDKTVHISLSFVDTRIIVQFSNHFESLQPDEVEKIFQPFQRGSNAVKEPGYGLGLSLTRRIILLHKGEIKAEVMDKDKLLISVILPSSFSGVQK
ncbi:MAG: HAMP domain-containing sensor histidine kinase [Bacteroidota bacterium]